MYAYVFYPRFYTLLINYLLCAPPQSHIHQGLGIFLLIRLLPKYIVFRRFQDITDHQAHGLFYD